jgi:hypothetical protein
MTSSEEGLANGRDTGMTQKVEAAEMRHGKEGTRQGEETGMSESNSPARKKIREFGRS